MRLFKGGASRDDATGKPDYDGFISPRVFIRFGQYMDKHRVQADGGLRDSDNWQNHFGEDHFAVCMKSAWRHFVDWWSEHRGGTSREGIEDALCALMFNVIAYMDKLLKDKE